MDPQALLLKILAINKSSGKGTRAAHVNSHIRSQINILELRMGAIINALSISIGSPINISQ